MSKFFEDNEEQQEEQQEQEKITLGETEFTQEELEELVGKARKVKEFEEKQGQSWEDVTKSWGQRGERIGELKKRVEEYEAKEAELSKPKEQLDAEAMEKQIKAEAKKYGFILNEDLDKIVTERYNQLREVERVLSRTKKVIRENVKKGYPKVSEKELLEYMNDPFNPADPEKAYKLMFEKERAEIDAKKVDSIKPRGMRTEEKSTAGGKDFQPQKVTKETLSQALRDHFKAGGEG